MSTPVTTDVEDDIAVIRFDDGKANALGHDAMAALETALDDVEHDARAVILLGRPGKFSAGFDLTVMREGPAAAQEMVRRGALLCMRLYGYPRPVIAGSDGHALAAGALVLLSCDVRIGSDTPGRIGLPETTIGMPLPVFATELARDRLSKRHFTAATLLGTTYGPDQAVDVGFLDRVEPGERLEPAAREVAAHLAESLSPSGFAMTRTNVRQATIDHVLATLDEDMARFTVTPG